VAGGEAVRHHPKSPYSFRHAGREGGRDEFLHRCEILVTTQAAIASAVREAISDERIGDCFAAARLAMTGGLSSYKF